MHHMELEGVGGHAVFLKIHSDKEEGGKERLGFKTDRQKKLDANSVLKSTELSHYAVKAQMPSSFLKNDNCPFLKGVSIFSSPSSLLHSFTFFLLPCSLFPNFIRSPTRVVPSFKFCIFFLINIKSTQMFLGCHFPP